MIIPLLQPCCRHMFVSGIGWRLNIFFSKKGWKFCVALRMVSMLVSLFKTSIDCYLWKRKNCLVTTAWRSFSFFHNSNRNIKWIHDIETHLQNVLAYKTQLLITLFNINIMIFFRYVPDTKITLLEGGYPPKVHSENGECIGRFLANQETVRVRPFKSTLNIQSVSKFPPFH